MPSIARRESNSANRIAMASVLASRQTLVALSQHELNWSVVNVAQSIGANASLLSFPVSVVECDRISGVRLDLTSAKPLVIFFDASNASLLTVELKDITGIAYVDKVSSCSLQSVSGCPCEGWQLRFSGHRVCRVFGASISMLAERIQRGIASDMAANSCFSTGVVIIHQGVVKLKSTLTDAQQKLFAVLLEGRIVFFRRSRESTPLLVLATETMQVMSTAEVPAIDEDDIGGDDDGYDASCVYQSLVLTTPDKGVIELITASKISRKKWLKALSLENTLRNTRRLGVAKTKSQMEEMVPKMDDLLDNSNFFQFVFTELREREVVARSLIGSQPLRWTRSNKTTKLLDKALSDYQALTLRCSNLIRYTLLICGDTGHASSHAQLAFAFPGFNEEIFSVGQCSVVSAWSCFQCSGRFTAFGTEEWTGALNSESVGKELMQSMPDVNDLFDLGMSKQAKDVSFESTACLVRNAFLAQLLNTNRTTNVLSQAPANGWTMQQLISAAGGSRNQETLCRRFRNNVFMIDMNPRFIFDLITGKARSASTTDLVLLCRPVEFLGMLWTTLQHRRKSMTSLLALLSDMRSRPEDPQHFSCIEEIYHLVVEEMCELATVLAVLPDLSAAAELGPSTSSSTLSPWGLANGLAQMSAKLPN